MSHLRAWRGPVIVAAGCAAGFGALWVALAVGWLGGQSLDPRIEGSVHRSALQHHWLVTAARDVTQFGSPIAVDLAALGVALALVAVRRWPAAAFVIGVRLLTSLTCDGVKVIVARPRPRFSHPIAHASGWSFPSGHASGAASLYLPLAVLVAAALGARWRRAVVTTLALVVCLLVAASRVVLGVHYPSDVLAGVLLGAAFTAAGVSAWHVLSSAEHDA